MTDHEAAEPSFRITTATNETRPGQAVCYIGDDGKGVSGLLAGVEIGPGGLPFHIVVTHDGRWPDERPENVSDGANDVQGDDTRADTEERLLRLLRAAEQRAALLYRDNERLRARSVAEQRARTVQTERIRELEMRLRQELADEPKPENKLTPGRMTVNNFSAPEPPESPVMGGTLKTSISGRPIAFHQPQEKQPGLRVVHQADGSITIRPEMM